MANNFVWVNATTLNGTLWDNGTLLSAVPITQIGALTIGGSTKKYLDAQLTNTGNITTNAVGVVYFQDGAILNNSGNFELQSGVLQNVSSLSSPAVGTFKNSGTLKKTTLGNGSIVVNFNNTGTVNVESGILTIGGGGVSDGGIFNITSGKTLTFDAWRDGYTLSNGSKINGNGNLTLVGLFNLKLSEGAAIASTVQLTIDSLHNPELFGFQVDQDWTLPTITKWNGGTFKSTGILTNKGSLTIGGGRKKYLDAQLNNTGNITTNAYVDTGVVYFKDGVIVNNSGNFELQSGAFSKVESSAVGTFNNSGTLRKTTSGDGIIGFTFNNTGTVNVESGILTLMGGVSNGGIFNITSGKTLKFGGSSGFHSGYTLGNGSKINGNGNLILESHGRLFDLKLSEGAAIASTVQFTIDSTMHNFSLWNSDAVAGFQVDQDWTLPTITNWNGGTLKSPGVLTNSGTLTIGGGKKKYLDAKLNNTGNIVGNFLNETLPLHYNLIFQVGSVLNNSGNFKLQSGTIGFLDGAIFNNYGNFELHEVGILNIANGIDISEGTINNFGTFKKTTITTGGFGFTNVNFNNKGTVIVEAGTLRLYGGVSDGGIFNINSGKTLIFNSIYTLSNGTKINGDGNLIVKYGILDLKVSEGATIANTVKLTVDTVSGGFHVDGDWTLPTTTNWISGTFKSTGILTNSGNLNLIDGSPTGSARKLDGQQLNNTGKIFHDRGNLKLLDGAILNNSGNYEVKVLSGYSISIGGTFNNSGTYTKTLRGENFVA
ncbi:MAG: beta strand repeat-containing protein, partial [Cuspidothrix sp.]